MSERDFLAWIGTMRQSINTYTYYVDFEKVYKNVEKKRIQLNLLNTLVNNRHVKASFFELLDQYPEVLSCIPIVLAVRNMEIYAQDEKGAFIYNFDKINQTPEQYAYFMEKTGLFELLSERIIQNTYDYCLGIETGLDSNGRKNRGGHQMENLVQSYIAKTGVPYYKEMKLSEVEKKWGVDLSAISAEGTTEKRWDFVVKTPSCIYLIETNFYSSGGSKLNETSRSYKMIAEEAKSIPEVQFVWITDGAGWRSATRNLEETFRVMDTLYNIRDLEQGALARLFAE